MELSKHQFDLDFKGFQIVDCCVRSKRFFYFSLREDYTQRANWAEGDEIPEETSLERRIVSFSREKVKDGKGWGHAKLSGVKNMVAGVAYHPKEQFVGVDAYGDVYVLGAGESGCEEDIARSNAGGINRGTVDKSRTIEGVLYVAGGNRSVGYRSDKNKWISLTQMLPFDEGREWESAGFEDIDGFSRSDIYCVGGKGDVCHFDGEQWRQIHFPSNVNLYTVCCAGDGFVYVSGYGGHTFRGRGDSWTQIYKGDMPLPFKDMGWFDGKVWCTSDYGLWTIEKDEVKAADVSDDVRAACGCLDIADGILLVGGYNGAAYKENGRWNVIF